MLLEDLRERRPADRPGLPELHRALAEVTHQLAEHGPFNSLLSDGEYLFAHTSTELHRVGRRAPFGPAHLLDEDLTVDFAAHTTPQDRVAVIATAPLTDNEQWAKLPSGKLLVFHDGGPVDP